MPKHAAQKKPAAHKLVIAPDIAARVAKFKPIHIAFDSSKLSDREKKMVDKLVDAAGLLDCIYWRQSDPEGLKLYLSLADTKDPQKKQLREYLKINGGRYDLIDDNKPFVGTAPAPPGRGYFLPEETRENIEQLIGKGMLDRSAAFSPYTIEKLCTIKDATDVLSPCFVPYRTAFRKFLVPMARDLRQASELSDDPAFTKFLQSRAHALLTDDYFQSDIAWLDLKNPKFDIIFAPYETYLDGLLGVKTSYGASIMIRNDAESRKLAVYQKYVSQLQESLPLPAADLPSKHGKQSPMEVVDAIYRSGDLLHGYQAVADNLPNDPRIHEQKGSKKIFWKNFMDARVNDVILPLARRMMPPDQAAMVTGDGTLQFVILHEISHGLGPTYAHTAAGKVDVREAIGPEYSALEESKADIVGMRCIHWLVEHGAIPKDKLDEIYASYLGETFRTIRFGIAEAHGKGSMMEISYLTEQGAIRRDPSTGLYEVDFKKMPGAMDSLAKELLEQEDTGDRARTKNWFRKYAVMPTELSAALAKASDIPVDVDPEFDFHPPLE
ncbi:MAG TPA: Zn-dependent hydrolase [Candidatus Polarisedimenticolia bacterium]|nr:Zn-dependent hydrolase [Candidatus Polarisedimenticolia bacterium]